MSPLDGLPASVRERSTLRALAAGETLFRQGNRASTIFEVEEGRLLLTRATIDNRPVVLHTARKGELLAEASLFAASYHCDAVAAIASRVRVYPKRDLLAAFRSDPAISEGFMALLARQVHTLRTRLEERNIRSARPARDAPPGPGRRQGWRDGANRHDLDRIGGRARPHP